MALVNVLDVTVLDNPTSFTNPFQFDITFECVQELQDGNCFLIHFAKFAHAIYCVHYCILSCLDLEWKVTYVGSAEDATRDQTLEEVMVGPVNVGVNRFVLQAASPNVAEIPDGDLLGVTVILVTCSYLDQEFIRIGYYVNNAPIEGFDPENPPVTVDITTVIRNILADQPRVTRIPINWNGTPIQEMATFQDASNSIPPMHPGMQMDVNEDSMDVERMHA